VVKSEEFMKVGIYARVSTEKQEESLEEQVKILEEFCKRSGYEIYNVYSETRSGQRARERSSWS